MEYSLQSLHRTPNGRGVIYLIDMEEGSGIRDPLLHLPPRGASRRHEGLFFRTGFIGDFLVPVPDLPEDSHALASF